MFYVQRPWNLGIEDDWPQHCATVVQHSQVFGHSTAEPRPWLMSSILTANPLPHGPWYIQISRFTLMFADWQAQVIPKMTKHQQELETRLKLPQVIHTLVSIFILCNLNSTDILQQLCNSCAQKKEKECTEPLSLICNFCWKPKKSCMNRGKWIILFS